MRLAPFALALAGLLGPLLTYAQAPTTCMVYTNSIPSTTGVSTINVGDSFDVGTIQVGIQQLLHRRIGALKIWLENRDASGTIITQVLLKDQGLGRLGNDMIGATFSDSATTTFPDTADAAPFTGTYLPSQPLTTLAAGSGVAAGSGGSSGSWVLHIEDVAPNASNRFLSLNSWWLRLCPAGVQPVTSGAPSVAAMGGLPSGIYNPYTSAQTSTTGTGSSYASASTPSSTSTSYSSGSSAPAPAPAPAPTPAAGPVAAGPVVAGPVAAGPVAAAPTPAAPKPQFPIFKPKPLEALKDVNKDIIYKSMIHSLYASAIGEAALVWLEDAAIKHKELDQWWCKNFDRDCDNESEGRVMAFVESVRAFFEGTQASLSRTTVAQLFTSLFEAVINVVDRIDTRAAQILGNVLLRLETRFPALG